MECLAVLPYGGARVDTMEICPLPTCYPADFGRSRPDGTSVVKEIRHKKIDPSHPACQCH